MLSALHTINSFTTATKELASACRQVASCKPLWQSASGQIDRNKAFGVAPYTSLRPTSPTNCRQPLAKQLENTRFCLETEGCQQVAIQCLGLCE